MKVATLLSGGLDSAVLLAALLEAEHDVRVVHVLSNDAEARAAQALAAHFGHVDLAEVDASGAYADGGGLLGLLAQAGLAATLARHWQSEGLALSVHGGKAAPAVQLSHVLRIGLQIAGPLDLLAPFVDHPKAGLVAIGATLGVPFEKTYSCDDGRRFTHCGECQSCRERHAAFVAADVPDPTSYEVEPEGLDDEDDDAGEEPAGDSE